MEEFERLSRESFSQCKSASCTGRLSSDEKRRRDASASQNEVQILVATTVVGWRRCAERNVMVIEHANVSASRNSTSFVTHRTRAAKIALRARRPRRMTTKPAPAQTMVRTCNGFEIAETDLELRGPGEIFRVPAIRRPRLSRSPTPSATATSSN